MVLLFHDIQLQILILFMLAIAVTVIIRYIRLPYTIALVLTGLVVGTLGFDSISLSKEIILFLFLPPLLFEAALHINVKELFDNFKPVLLLSVIGITAQVFLVAMLINIFTRIPFIYCLLFGSIIMPTDPVSVIAMLKEMGVSKRLSLILEGESLFDDGTAIVLYTIILSIIENNHFSFALTTFNFFKSYAGGIIIGISIGYLTVRLLQKILADDSIVVVILTIIVAYLTFIICESLHFSGVIGVVVAGLFIGHNGVKHAMSPSSKIALTTFWGIVSFIVNSMIFIMIGLKVPFRDIIKEYKIIFLAIAAVLFVRSLIVYLVSGLLNHFGEKIPAKWQHVMNFGGIRGSIPIALLLGLHLTNYMPELTAMVYGVALFSVIVQGSCLFPLIKSMKLSGISAVEADYEINLSKKLAIKKAREELKKMYLSDEITDETFKSLDQMYNQKFEEINEKIRENLLFGDIIRIKQEKTAKRKTLIAEKVSIRDSIKGGMLSLERGYVLLKEVDLKLDSLDLD
ncbi:MAG: Na+/H+ antiporter [Nanoarchaeota archaeon]|nr:Na+/H+ antiporter [Nanoarchaeota archaeon]